MEDTTNLGFLDSENPKLSDNLIKAKELFVKANSLQEKSNERHNIQNQGILLVMSEIMDKVDYTQPISDVIGEYRRISGPIVNSGVVNEGEFNKIWQLTLNNFVTMQSKSGASGIATTTTFSARSNIE